MHNSGNFLFNHIDLILIKRRLTISWNRNIVLQIELPKGHKNLWHKFLSLNLEIRYSPYTPEIVMFGQSQINIRFTKTSKLPISFTELKKLYHKALYMEKLCLKEDLSWQLFPFPKKINGMEMLAQTLLYKIKLQTKEYICLRF